MCKSTIGHTGNDIYFHVDPAETAKRVVQLLWLVVVASAKPMPPPYTGDTRRHDSRLSPASEALIEQG